MSSITLEEMQALPFAFATPSLGMHPSHTLDIKIDSMEKAGYKNIELGFGDFMNWVRSQRHDLPASTCPQLYKRDDEPDPGDDVIWQTLFDEAARLRDEVNAKGMSLIIFQPMSQYEGWPESSSRSEWVRAKARRWLKLCSLLGVKFLQLGSNDQADAIAPYTKLVEDVRYLAQLGSEQSPPVRISYEPWCFSPRTPDWEACWKVVQDVDHPNLGLCLDTAHIALAPGYGFVPTTGRGHDETQLQGALQRIREIPGDKIDYYEISDVIAPTPALLQGSAFDSFHQAKDADPRPLFTWSMCGRCIPLVGANAGDAVGNKGDMGAARCAEVTKAIFDTGFRGPLSWEVFEHQYMSQADPSVPSRYAEAGMVSRARLFEAIASM